MKCRICQSSLKFDIDYERQAVGAKCEKCGISAFGEDMDSAYRNHQDKCNKAEEYYEKAEKEQAKA